MKQRFMLLNKFTAGIVLLFGLTACATIPPESADLSIELGKRISAIETSHITLVEKFFAYYSSNLLI